MRPEAGATVAVAVSGGMDSLLALCLLKEKGLDVRAVHARFLRPDASGEAMLARLEAACAALSVPLAVLDLREEFKARVVTPFADEYARARTPNPCAVCNRAMKFGLLREAARERLGARLFATGHYARFAPPESARTQCAWTPGALLFPAADAAKNQIYFLALVPGERLKDVIFPLGGILKSDVPALLAERGLEVPQPGESQEICFVPDNDYPAFLQKRGGALAGAGPVRLSDGRRIGSHAGLWRCTEGQRRGLGIAWSEPLYVIKKDAATNTLIVGGREEAWAAGCHTGGVNLFLERGAWPPEVSAQLRYRQRPVPVRVEDAGQGGLRVCFTDRGDIPAPGQTIAFFAPGGHLLGGGVIEAPFHNGA